jgi:hypothetical protein
VKSWFIMSLMCVIWIGCGSVPLRDNLILGEQIWQTAPGIVPLDAAGVGEEFPGLCRVARQVLGESPCAAVAPYENEPDPLPEALARTAYMEKLVRALLEASRGKGDTRVSVSQGELEEFASAVVDEVGALAISPSVQLDAIRLADAGTPTVGALMLAYLRAYYEGEFVDRSGSLYSKPELGNKIGNDTIGAVISVVLEAFFDYAFKTPIYFEATTVYVDSRAKGGEDDAGAWFLPVKRPEQRKDYFTKEGRTPTVAAFMAFAEAPVAGDGAEGVTKGEFKLARRVAGMAGDKAKGAAGLVVRSFGSLEVQFMIGGDFTFGDNDTFSKIVETTFEVSARRSTEALALRALKSTGVPDVAPHAAARSQLHLMLDADRALDGQGGGIR